MTIFARERDLVDIRCMYVHTYYTYVHIRGNRASAGGRMRQREMEKKGGIPKDMIG